MQDPKSGDRKQEEEGKVEEEQDEECTGEEAATSDLYNCIHQLSEKIMNQLNFHEHVVVGSQGRAEDADVPAVRDERAPCSDNTSSLKKMDGDEKLQKALEKMARLDAKLLELVKVISVF